MTAQQIADAYRLGAHDARRSERDRLGKAKRMAQRFKVDWKQVEQLIKAHDA